MPHTPAGPNPRFQTPPYVSTGPAYTISCRPKEKPIDDVPGPGTYNLPDIMGTKTQLFPSAPVYSFSGCPKTCVREKTPPLRPEAPPLIGRVGTWIKSGLVGLPNSGKSTFYNVLTKSQVAADSFPFCTVEPKESRVPVHDSRLDFLCQYHQAERKVPIFLNVMDIAALVNDAHSGQGLGNAFLSHVNSWDMIFHITRAFEDTDGMHVGGNVDPVRDLAIIHEELRLKDQETMDSIIDKLKKTIVNDDDQTEYDIMIKIKNQIEKEKRHVRFYKDWNKKEIDVLNKYVFLTSKPTIYLVNLSENDLISKTNKWLPKIKKWVDAHDPGAMVIPVSGAVEIKLSQMNEDERITYWKEHKTQSVQTRLQTSLFAALQLIVFYTAGMFEARAWPIQKGTKAPEAAGKIHSNFQNGFTGAEVTQFHIFRDKGEDCPVKLRGAEYTIQDGDIIYFISNLPFAFND